ncbi:MAG: hypothetical protein CM1200mP40_20480 [Gammaproteobacteria bacterium]|nr:MAG: hypothetical protein CM1200mP40_20480 [Gammaproteobacteria bacterium]
MECLPGSKAGGSLSAGSCKYRLQTDDNRRWSALLEAHILDFDEDLYDKTIEIIFRKKVREELKFDGLDALKKQMTADVEQVREIFSQAP